MKETNPLVFKSKAFALKVIKIYFFLCKQRQEYNMSRQILRSATSIGANIREAQRAQTYPDFYAKISISLKEADETAYWLELLHESELISDEQFESLFVDCDELIRMLVAATNTVKKQMALKKTSRTN